jgi:hypothetical protein
VNGDRLPTRGVRLRLFAAALALAAGIAAVIVAVLLLRSVLG